MRLYFYIVSSPRNPPLRVTLIGKSIINDSIIQMIGDEAFYVGRITLNKGLIIVFANYAFANFVDFIVCVIIVQSLFLPLESFNHVLGNTLYVALPYNITVQNKSTFVRFLTVLRFFILIHSVLLIFVNTKSSTRYY